MNVAGFALMQRDTVVAHWTAVPPRIDLPNGDVLMGADAKWASEEFKIVPYSWMEPDPGPVRRLIEKSLILERITDAQLSAALGVMTPRQKERWRMPGKPAIYVDDPELLDLLAAVGADPAVVLA